MTINLSIGQNISTQRRFSENDIALFSQLSGDTNPIHLSEEFASHTDFQHKIVPGVLIVSLFSKIFGTMISDYVCIWKSQSFKFIKPVYFNEPLIAIATLKSYDTKKDIAIFDTTCYKNNNEIILTGESQIKFKPLR